MSERDWLYGFGRAVIDLSEIVGLTMDGDLILRSGAVVNGSPFKDCIADALGIECSDDDDDEEEA